MATASATTGTNGQWLADESTGCPANTRSQARSLITATSAAPRPVIRVGEQAGRRPVAGR